MIHVPQAIQRKRFIGTLSLQVLVWCGVVQEGYPNLNTSWKGCIENVGIHWYMHVSLAIRVVEQMVSGGGITNYYIISGIPRNWSIYIYLHHQECMRAAHMLLTPHNFEGHHVSLVTIKLK